MKYFIATIIVIVAFAVFVFTTRRSEEGGNISPQDVKNEIVFLETEHDFGILKQSGGVVSYEFPFIYKGDIERDIVGVPTSCGCTSAKVDTDTLKPGQKGVLTVMFDPNLHAEPEGRFFKTAEILTEPPFSGIESVKIWAQIDLDLGPDAYKQSGHNEEGEHTDDHLDGKAYHTLSASALKTQLQEKDFFLLDVHIPEQAHIPSTDAVIPFNALRENADALPKDKNAKIVLYCRSGSMSRQAVETLTDMGYTNVWDLDGGINAYNAL